MGSRHIFISHNFLTHKWPPSRRHLEYIEMLNDARVASLGFFKDNICTTRINKEKKFQNQVPGPPKIGPDSAGLQGVIPFILNHLSRMALPTFIN